MNVTYSNKDIGKYYKGNKFSEGITETNFPTNSYGRSPENSFSSAFRSDEKMKSDHIEMQTRNVESTENQEKQYLQTLSEKEIKAYEIAKKCLGTSFQLKKSNGYLSWLKEKSTDFTVTNTEVKI
jgi:hypothetical protein